MTKKKAVATREAKTPAQQLAQAIELQHDAYANVLPEGVSVEKFMRTTMTAIQNTPALVKADRRTLFHACARAAQDGLLPDGRQGAIVCFNDTATWMPMVEGRILQAARNGITIKAHVVYQYEMDNDLFRVELGDNPSIHHTPAPFGVDRGDIVGAYAIATLPNGEKIRELMHRDEIDKVRAASRSGGKGPWKDWFDRMARKSVINRLAKSLPDEDLRASVAAEEVELYGSQVTPDGTILDPTPTPTTGKRPKALQQVIEQHSDPEPDEADEPTNDDEPEGEL